MRKPLLLLSLLALCFTKVLADNGDGFTLQFCKEVATWYKMLDKNKLDYKCYIHITPEVATKIAGNRITDISFSTTTDFSTSPRSGFVFVTESLDGEMATRTDCTMLDCEKQYRSGKEPFQTVALEEPYTIKENTGFYFGYCVKSCRYSTTNGADYPVGVDGKSPNGFSGCVELTDATNGELIGVVDLGAELGTDNTNLFLAAKTVGEAQGLYNIVTLGNMTVGNLFTLPVYSNVEQTERLSLPIKNNGLNEIQTIDYTVDVNGETSYEQTFSTSIAPGAERTFQLEAPEYVYGRNKVSFNVTKINGSDLNLSTSASLFVMDDDGYPRKMLVEEGTGTGCGWCPRGIVGVDNMYERYPESFIGIAVHGNNPSPDKMTVASYQPLINTFFGGAFPNCIVNRDPKYVLDPSINYLELCHNYWSEQSAPAKIDLEVEPLMGGLRVTANTTFAHNEEQADYKLAFVIMEDGLRDTQTNYYHDSPGSLEWWGEQGETVEWTYTNTARDIFDCFGLPGSVPTSIEGGRAMSYSVALSATNVTNLKNTSVVAILLDGKTGVALNAAKVDAKDYRNSNAINDITLSADKRTEYYNAQGMRLSNTKKGGIVICRTPQRTYKTHF